MSNLHDLLTLNTLPITLTYVGELRKLLRSGIPATYTLEQAAAHEAGRDEEEDTGSNTTPLHVLMRSLPATLTEEETKVVLEMMDILFEYGAGWNFLDYENKSPGEVLWGKGYQSGNPLYERIVEAGVSAELLLRRLDENIEFLDEDCEEEPDKASETESSKELQAEKEPRDTAEHQDEYLQAKLEYTDNSLVTKENRDGVMMDWETDIMRLARDSMFKYAGDKPVVLNIGFGMGIIDTLIQERNPHKHYICEAHPDVLARMRKDGWFERDNVIVLEGRWQDTLSTLLDEGSVFFDAIYYDTFSEHYTDMLELYDNVVGLLKPEGIFSFFNGLGADRRVCYDVYRRVVDVDVRNYGMQCRFVAVPLPAKPDWENVRRSYFSCDTYFHPEIRFA